MPFPRFSASIAFLCCIISHTSFANAKMIAAGALGSKDVVFWRTRQGIEFQVVGTPASVGMGQLDFSKDRHVISGSAALIRGRSRSEASVLSLPNGAFVLIQEGKQIWAYRIARQADSTDRYDYVVTSEPHMVLELKDGLRLVTAFGARAGKANGGLVVSRADKLYIYEIQRENNKPDAEITLLESRQQLTPRHWTAAVLPRAHDYLLLAPSEKANQVRIEHMVRSPDDGKFVLASTTSKLPLSLNGEEWAACQDIIGGRVPMVPAASGK